MPQPDPLSATAGLVLSLAFSYIPGLSGAYAKLSETTKMLIMAVLLACVALGSVLWTCRSASVIGGCVSESWGGYFQAFISALVANQAAHRLSPQTAEVKAAKAEAQAAEPAP